MLGAATLQTLGQTYERPLGRAVAALGNLTGSGLPSRVTSHDEGKAFGLRRIMGCFVEEKGMLASAHQKLIGIRVYFKTVNDTYGHRAGDAALQTVGRLLAAHLTEYGLVGRLGGEEFAVISSVASVEQILPALRNALHAIAETPIVIAGSAIRVTLSAGVAVRGPSEPFEKLYSDADEALYRAKRAGRNRIELSGRSDMEAPRGDGPGHDRVQATRTDPGAPSD